MLYQQPLFLTLPWGFPGAIKSDSPAQGGFAPWGQRSRSDRIILRRICVSFRRARAMPIRAGGFYLWRLCLRGRAGTRRPASAGWIGRPPHGALPHGVLLERLRDWVHRFNAEGPDGLKDKRAKGQPARLNSEQLARFAEIVETGPDRARDGVVRWRRLDLQR